MQWCQTVEPVLALGYAVFQSVTRFTLSNRKNHSVTWFRLLYPYL